MGSTSRAAAVVLTAMCLLPLSGCLPATPSVIPTTAATSAPVFADEEEALAAAIEAFGAYLKISDAITADGGVNPERISPLVNDDYREDALMAFAPYQTEQLSTRGDSTFDSVVLQRYTEDGSGRAHVDLYVCLDVSSVQVIDAEGDDITPVSRQNRLPLELGFTARQKDELLLSRSDLWAGEDFCAE